MKIDISFNVVALVCAVGAIIIASTGHDGWGWLVFVAIVALTR